MNLYWGDLHNHCAASYGKGTPGQALANAQQHLDFCTITGHAFWPDLPMDLVTQDRIIGMHLGGFAKLQHFWPQLQQQLAQANQPGRFVTLPSYEWHSMQYGDYNCYAACDDLALLNANSPQQLHQAQTKAGCGAIVLPHHIGYARGFRGINWDAFDAARSPLVEIYSNHGAGEADDAGYAYHHSMGPRSGLSLARQGLLLGHRFGFYASTDSHDGYPGHYGHGRVGVLADTLTREAIWEGLCQRRTIASTGVRMTARFSLGDATVGGQTQRQDQLPLALSLTGSSSLDKVELIHGSASGQWTVQPLALPARHSRFEPGRYKVRIETGWGRGQARTCWEVQARVESGTLVGIEPCFRYSGQGNDQQQPSEQIDCHNEQLVQWRCCSQPNPAGLLGGTHFSAGGTQSVVLEIEARDDTQLKVQVNGQQVTLPMTELASHSLAQPIGGFGSPAFAIHRAVPQQEYRVSYELPFKPQQQPWGFVYVRAVQADGQTAWLSPVWYQD